MLVKASNKEANFIYFSENYQLIVGKLENIVPALQIGIIFHFSIECLVSAKNQNFLLFWIEEESMFTVYFWHNHFNA